VQANALNIHALGIKRVLWTIKI